MSKQQQREIAFLKSRMLGGDSNSQSTHHSIIYSDDKDGRTPTSWDNYVPYNPSYRYSTPSHQQHDDVLGTIIRSKPQDTFTVVVDGAATNRQQLEDLATVIGSKDTQVKGVAMHNVQAIMPHSSNTDFVNVQSNNNAQSTFSQSMLVQSALSSSALSQSALSQSTLFQSMVGKSALSVSCLSQSSLNFLNEKEVGSTALGVHFKLVEKEQASLRESLPVIFSKADNIKLGGLSLCAQASRDLIFEILGGVKCTQLSLSASDINEEAVVKLYELMVSNTYIKNLDISGFPSHFLNVASEMIIYGCVENPQLKVKYCAAHNNFNVKDYQTLNEFSRIRAEAYEDNNVVGDYQHILSSPTDVDQAVAVVGTDFTPYSDQA